METTDVPAVQGPCCAKQLGGATSIAIVTAIDPKLVQRLTMIEQVYNFCSYYRCKLNEPNKKALWLDNLSPPRSLF